MLLVHPLYDLYFTNQLSLLFNKKNLDAHLKNLNTRTFLKQRNKFLKIYSKFLLEQVKKDTVVLVLIPSLKPFYEGYVSKTGKHMDLTSFKILENMYNEAQINFIDFFKKKYSNRFFVYQGEISKFTDPNKIFKNETYKKDFLKRFNTKLKILALGEYFIKKKDGFGGCVTSYTKKIVELLRYRNIASEVFFMKKYTLSFKEGGFRKAVLKPTDRRKLQNKEKKKKLIIKKRLK